MKKKKVCEKTHLRGGPLFRPLPALSISLKLAFLFLYLHHHLDHLLLPGGPYYLSLASFLVAKEKLKIPIATKKLISLASFLFCTIT